MNVRYVCSGLNAPKHPETPTVFVVDGDASVRDSLERMIRSAGWQPSMASSAEEFLSRPRVMAPSCLVLDLNLPDSSGLDLQRRVLDRTELSVVFISSYTDVRATVQAMKAGAFEFLTKPLVDEVLMKVIGDAIAHSHVALRREAQIRALEARYESLSRREREVMSLIVSGRLNKQVGDALGISEITVKAHRGKMMRKMQAASFAELVNMAVRLEHDRALRA